MAKSTDKKPAEEVIDNGNVTQEQLDTSEADEGSTTRLRETVPYQKEDGSIGYQEVPRPEGPQVTYVGSANKRILSKEDWERVGAGDCEEAVWDITNAKMLPKSQFNDKQLAYLKRDGRFKIDED